MRIKVIGKTAKILNLNYRNMTMKQTIAMPISRWQMPKALKDNPQNTTTLVNKNRFNKINSSWSRSTKCKERQQPLKNHSIQ